MMGKYSFSDCWNSLPKWEQRHRNSPGWCSREEWDNVCESALEILGCTTHVRGCCDVIIPPRAGEQRTLEISHSPDEQSDNNWSTCCSVVALAKVIHLFMSQAWQDTIKLQYHQKLVTPPAALGVDIDFPRWLCFWLSCPNWKMNSWYDFFQGWNWVKLSHVH